MRVFLRAALAVSAVCLLQGVGSAGTLMVAGSGVFSPGAPTTTYSAPNTAWSFSFNVADVPVVSNVDSTVGFDVAFSNFTYDLGLANVTVTPARIRFFTGSNLGLFNINIVDTTSPPNGNPVTGFEFSGGQAFSDPTSAPTILTGAYPTSAASFFSSSAQVDSFSGVTINITPTEAGPSTPEPATLAVAAAACCLFGWMRRRQSVR